MDGTAHDRDDTLHRQRAKDRLRSAAPAECTPSRPAPSTPRSSRLDGVDRSVAGPGWRTAHLGCLDAADRAIATARARRCRRLRRSAARRQSTAQRRRCTDRHPVSAVLGRSLVETRVRHRRRAVARRSAMPGPVRSIRARTRQRGHPPHEPAPAVAASESAAGSAGRQGWPRQYGSAATSPRPPRHDTHRGSRATAAVGAAAHTSAAGGAAASRPVAK